MSDETAKKVAQAILWIEEAERALQEQKDLAQKVRAQHALLQRIAFRFYLDGIVEILTRGKYLDARQLQPLIILSDNLAGLDSPGEVPELFKASPKELGLTKPMNRLVAEGQAVGCVVYLIEAVGYKPMFACERVALMFGHMGHKPRVKDNLHSGQTTSRLSAKTVYGWYSELGSSRTIREGENLFRQMAKIGTIKLLEQAERDEPILHLQGPELRIQLAQRIMVLAAKTLLGSADGPGVRRVLSENSE